MGQPGILTGDTRVPSVSIPGCPTSEPGFKGKLGEDVGQPGILTCDTKVSHTSPKDKCGYKLF